MVYTVKIREVDIRRIEKVGYKREYFCEPDLFDPKFGKFSLKRPGNRCIFLVKDNVCKIYSSRPKICRDYPFNEQDFIESCDPDLAGNRLGKH